MAQTEGGSTAGTKGGSTADIKGSSTADIKGGSTARTKNGFTLIEVLVAFVIASLALGVLFEGSVTGLKSTRISTHYAQALSRARSHLAALLVQPLGLGVQDGDDGGGFHWQTQVAALGVDAIPGPAGTPMPALYGLRATISWQMDGAPRQVTLHSERLASTVAGSP